MDDHLSRFCCLNPGCPDHGQRGHGNLTACARYGKHQRRLLYCKSCKARFSERKGTPLFGSHLPDDKALAVLAHLADGRSTSARTPVAISGPPRFTCSVRKTVADALWIQFFAGNPATPRVVSEAPCLATRDQLTVRQPPNHHTDTPPACEASKESVTLSSLKANGQFR